ncbi:hypothetical protein CYMTET_22568 [Cymbomonas tetramitiformis]|uniref:Uncharacterized protein n=1 Tax=Cymbomonas tetramitiformis TaxID=36881 RepID=A0AAE0G061_9CHLO|nr:hypothetical protein CYMTET_22568 [Cymbomonas tetramitiformis]
MGAEELPSTPVKASKSLREKYEDAKMIEGEVQRRIQDWGDAMGKDVVTSLIFKHFKSKALELHGENFNLAFFFGKIKTNSVVASYIVRYLTKLCTIEDDENKYEISINSPEVRARSQKLVDYTRGEVALGNIANCVTCLLEFDLFLPVLEASTLEVAKLEGSEERQRRRGCSCEQGSRDATRRLAFCFSLWRN